MKVLSNEMLQISGLTTIEATKATMKLDFDDSKLSTFYACLNDEWKKDFILNLIHPYLSPLN